MFTAGKIPGFKNPGVRCGAPSGHEGKNAGEEKPSRALEPWGRYGVPSGHEGMIGGELLRRIVRLGRAGVNYATPWSLFA